MRHRVVFSRRRRSRLSRNRKMLALLLLLLILLFFTIAFISPRREKGNQRATASNGEKDEESPLRASSIDPYQYCEVASREEMHARLHSALYVTVPHKKTEGPGVAVSVSRKHSSPGSADTGEPQLFLHSVARGPRFAPKPGPWAGWNCLVAWDPNAQCIIAGKAFVLFDSTRKKTEYGVGPYELPKATADSENDPLLLKQEIQFRIPTLCIRGVPCPVAIEAAPHLQHLLKRTLTDTVHHRKGKYEQYSFSHGIRLQYGRGSFWLIDAHDNSATLKVMREKLLEKAYQTKGPKVKRSPFTAHYYFERHVAVHLSQTRTKGVECHTAMIDYNPPRTENLEVTSCWISLDKKSLPLIDSADAFMRYFIKVENDKNPTCIVLITRLLELRSSATPLDVVVPPGCTLLFDADAGILVGPGVALHIRGDPLSARRSLLTAAPSVSHWAGIIVEPNGALVVEDAIISLTGSAGHKRRKGTGTHITYASPAITGVGSDEVSAKAAVIKILSSVFLNCAGPVFGVGEGTHLLIKDTLFQDVAQGGECVNCNATLERVHVLDVPFESYTLRNDKQTAMNLYVDGDNDGLYVRGGEVRLRHVVIANVLDDCIDSAASTPKKSTSLENEVVTHLHVQDATLHGCLHEGIALSSSAGAQRRVLVTNSIISDAQQGVENGHTPKGHEAKLSGVLFRRTMVALRHGDNYPLPVEGRVLVENSVFVDNIFHVLKEEFLWNGELRGWSNPFLETSKDREGHIILINCTLISVDSGDKFPRAGWWRINSNSTFLTELDRPKYDLAPLLCGRKHYDNG